MSDITDVQQPTPLGMTKEGNPFLRKQKKPKGRPRKYFSVQEKMEAREKQNEEAQRRYKEKCRKLIALLKEGKVEI